MLVERSLTAHAPHSKIVTVLTNKMFHILHFVLKLNSMKYIFIHFSTSLIFLLEANVYALTPVILILAILIQLYSLVTQRCVLVPKHENKLSKIIFMKYVFVCGHEKIGFWANFDEKIASNYPRLFCFH